MALKFHTVVEIYTTNTNVQSGFNIADFRNTGSCYLIINGNKLTSGQSWTALGYAGEIDTSTQYTVSFDPEGVNPQITVVKKIYNDAV